MFEAGMMATARMPGDTSPTEDVAKHVLLSPATEDLFYVFRHQHFSKQTFGDEYFKDTLCGSDKKRSLLTCGLLEK